MRYECLQTSGAVGFLGDVVRGVEILVACTELLAVGFAQDVGSTSAVGLKNVIETAVAIGPADDGVVGDRYHLALGHLCASKGRKEQQAGYKKRRMERSFTKNAPPIFSQAKGLAFGCLIG